MNFKIVNLKTTFPRFDNVKTAIYPAAKWDFLALRVLSKVFPNLFEVHLVDPYPDFGYYQGAFSPKISWPKMIFSDIWDALKFQLSSFFMKNKVGIPENQILKMREFSAGFNRINRNHFTVESFKGLLEELLHSRKLKLLRFDANGNDSINIFDPDNAVPAHPNNQEQQLEFDIYDCENRKIFRIKYFISDFFLANIPFKYDLAIAKTPGSHGGLSQKSDFWVKIIDYLKPGGVMWVDGEIDQGWIMDPQFLRQLGIQKYDFNLEFLNRLLGEIFLMRPQEEYPSLYFRNF